MLIGKSIQNFHHNKLFVDNWSVNYEHVNKSDQFEVDNSYSPACCQNKNNQCNVLLREKYEGKVSMEEVNYVKNLGHYISNQNNNMIHINQMRIKAINIKQKIFHYLQNLQVGKYYFECGVILMKSLLRTSILYSAETFYNLNEKEIRELEQIEEDFLRQLLGTQRGCPIPQIYLELGIYPARFELMKSQILFYHYIINQKEDSFILKFLISQKENPTNKGEWCCVVQSSMEYLNINISDDEMRHIKKQKLKKVLSDRINEKSLNYLLGIRGSKGKEIKYNRLEMSHYLMPNDSKMSVENKQYIFSMRNRMIQMSSNFSSEKEKVTCQMGCNEYENQQHIYDCYLYNEKNHNNKISYKLIYKDNIINQLKILKTFKENLEKRKLTMENNDNIPRDPIRDPL